MRKEVRWLVTQLSELRRLSTSIKINGLISPIKEDCIFDELARCFYERKTPCVVAEDAIFLHRIFYNQQDPIKEDCIFDELAGCFYERKTSCVVVEDKIFLHLI